MQRRYEGSNFRLIKFNKLALLYQSEMQYIKKRNEMSIEQMEEKQMEESM